MKTYLRSYRTRVLISIAFFVVIFFSVKKVCVAYDVVQGPATNPWPKLTQPTNTQSESIGAYTAGCLAGAIQLPMTGLGYEIMRPSRLRFFAHPDMYIFLLNVGAQSIANPLLIGDIAQPRGGPMNSSHISHQTGLDVDIWYLRKLDLTTTFKGGTRRELTPDWRETVSAQSVVDYKKLQLNSNWSKTIDPLLLWLAAQPNVNRFFVHPVIKKYFCKNYRSKYSLKKMRPWYGHDDHLHIRLSCPPEDKNCEVQDPIPSTDGCGIELDWWFSDEANRPPIIDSKKQRVFHLPERCRALTQDML